MVNIFDRQLYYDDSKIQADIDNAIGDIVVKNVQPSNLFSGESFVDAQSLQEKKRINGKLYTQVVKNNKVYWEEENQINLSKGYSDMTTPPSSAAPIVSGVTWETYMKTWDESTDIWEQII